MSSRCRQSISARSLRPTGSTPPAGPGPRFPTRRATPMNSQCVSSLRHSLEFRGFPFGDPTQVLWSHGPIPGSLFAKAHASAVASHQDTLLRAVHRADEPPLPLIRQSLSQDKNHLTSPIRLELTSPPVDAHERESKPSSPEGARCSPEERVICLF